MASRMWNHAPAMWAQISAAGLPVPAVSEQDAADLFAFFYSARYFEKPGDAAAATRVRREALRRLPRAHGRERQARSGRRQMQSLRDPIALVERMWNHLPQMKSETEKRKISWPELTTQDLTDMLVYLQNLPELRNSASTASFAIAAGSDGEQLFKSKGCANCHKGAMASISGSATRPSPALRRHVEPRARMKEPASSCRRTRCASCCPTSGPASSSSPTAALPRQARLRFQAVRHLPRPGHRAEDRGQRPVLRHHPGLGPVEARPAHADRIEAEEYGVAATLARADVGPGGLPRRARPPVTGPRQGSLYNSLCSAGPPSLEQLGDRPFSFYPAILGVDHNEWAFRRFTWSELLV